jgi:hypothetical protein
MGLIVSLFDYSGIMAQPWVEAGHTALIVDIQHPEGLQKRSENVWTLNHDLMSGMVYREDILGAPDFVAAFPPCDHLAVSGARWFRGKGLRKLADSINMFATAAEFCELSGAPYMIENPVSTISTYWRKPDYTFHPYEYAGYHSGDNYTKKTCLWTGGGFVMPEHAMTDAEPDDRIHKAPPGPERKNFRSATPLGFARAVYEANKPKA